MGLFSFLALGIFGLCAAVTKEVNRQAKVDAIVDRYKLEQAEDEKARKLYSDIYWEVADDWDSKERLYFPKFTIRFFSASNDFRRDYIRVLCDAILIEHYGLRHTRFCSGAVQKLDTFLVPGNTMHDDIIRVNQHCGYTAANRWGVRPSEGGLDDRYNLHDVIKMGKEEWKKAHSLSA